MIQNIKLIRNIGTFNSETGAKSPNFKRLVLIYGENGTGKTTIAAILRSLATNNPNAITERRRLGAEHQPHVVLQRGGNTPNAMFQNGAWNGTFPMKIFDDAFIDANVCSGLEVESQHRQNLAELVLGEQGVKLTRDLQEIIAQDDENGKIRNAKEQAIPSENLRGLTVREFCALPKLPDIDARIRDAERNLQAVREQDDVQATGTFDEVVLPAIDIDSIKQILSKGLAELDSKAESRVREHIASLTSVDEQWIAAGMNDNLQKDENKCPFCGQDTSGITLVSHYRAYFSDAYAELKRDISRIIDNLQSIHSQEAQLKFAGSIRDTERKGAFWSRFCDDVPAIDVDVDAVARDWNAALQAMMSILQSKQAAPLEKFDIADDGIVAVNQYNIHSQYANAFNNELEATNATILEFKRESALANSDELAKKLSLLRSEKDRHSEHIALLCSDYIQADGAKKFSEYERGKARKALDEHREIAFPEMRSAVNEYITRFNTGFHIESITFSNTRSGPSCTYNMLINDTAITVGRSNVPPGTPAFRNTLSAGDRSTLALALFFASLNKNPYLADTVVVMDDPMSSLDDHRSFATIREIRNLIGQAKQVIVLSHSKQFLCDVWKDISQKNDCVTVEITKTGTESSLREWDIHQDSLTEHDRRDTMLQEYITNGVGNRDEVAQAIRLHLESYLRVAVPASYRPGGLLGGFLKLCRSRVGTDAEILTAATVNELSEIVDYANQFHHASVSPHLNDTELRKFVRRTLDFVAPRKL